MLRRSLKFLLGADKNVNRKSWMTLQMNLRCLLMVLLSVPWHDHQEIDIGVGPGIAARVRTKEDDLLRLELAGDLICQGLNLTLRCHRVLF